MRGSFANRLPLHVPPPPARQVHSLTYYEEALIRQAYRRRPGGDRLFVASLFADSGLTAEGFARVVGWSNEP